MLLSVCLLLLWTGQSKGASAVPGSLIVTEGQNTTSGEGLRGTSALTHTPASAAADRSLQSPATGETLGTAALVLSVLALALVLVTLLWMALRKASASTLANLANVSSHQSAHPSSQFRGGPPKVGADTDVYMNYSFSNERYTNLDPRSRTVDSAYSSVS